MILLYLFALNVGGFFSNTGIAAELLYEHSARPLQAESTIDALETWETPISGFFIRSHLGVPVVPIGKEAQWVLKIDGLVDHPLTLTLSDLRKMPTHSLHAVLECSGNGRGFQKPVAPGVQWQRGAVGNAEWSGVSLAELLTKAGVSSNAHFVTLEGADQPTLPTVPKFIRSVPIAKALSKDTLVAFNMNREPIPILHGGPLRVIFPGWYGENWTKWVTHITLSEKEDPGFYMKKGYRIPKQTVNPGNAWDPSTGVPIERLRVQSFVTSPKSGQTFAKGMVTVAGKAFSGERTISKVELSIDNGKTWQLTQLEPPHSSGGWQEFHSDLNLTEERTWDLLTRATDSQDEQQPLDPNWNPGGYVRNSVDHLPFITSDQALPLGAEIMTQRCLICHSPQLIESQRLSPKQWESVVKKMEGFGAKLNDLDRVSLLKYLEKYSPELPHVDPPKTRYTIQLAQTEKRKPLLSGSKDRGNALYRQFCFACHGDHGEGKIGPRLIGRLIPEDEFWNTVVYGKRTMPGFGTILKTQQIADIQSFTQNFNRNGEGP